MGFKFGKLGMRATGDMEAGPTIIAVELRMRFRRFHIPCVPVPNLIYSCGQLQCLQSLYRASVSLPSTNNADGELMFDPLSSARV